MSPAHAEALLQQALQHHQAGRHGPAALGYAEVRKARPNSFEAHHLGGAVALQQGRIDEAVSLLRRAVQLRSSSGTTHMCLGLAYSQLGQMTEADKALKTAVRLEPDNFEAWSNLASILVLSGHLPAAVEAYQKSVQLRPDFAQGWTGLGSVLQLLGKSQEAIVHHTRALQLNPRHPKAQMARAQSLQSLHLVEASLADFEAHLLRHPDDLEAASSRLFLLNYLSEMPREKLFEEHRAYGRRLAARAPALPRSAFSATNDPDKRLRVAFFSPDLRAHSVAAFLEPLIRHLDPKEFEVVLYHDHFCVDEVSHRLAGHAALWRNFIGQSLGAVDAQIRMDRPDILIDLAGHTGLNRLPAFGRRLAPVQITYLGYPNTTGVQSMDYRFTDVIADPPGDSDRLHTEELVRFARTAWAYQPPVDSPAPSIPPSLTGQPFTFGSFNALSKVNAFTLKLWAEVLQAVPGSRLAVKSAWNEVSRQRIIEAGIAPDRLLLLPYSASTAEHLASYSQIDVALDPFPYHGTTTTCEALWMGVPVISLHGDRHASRVGASLLRAVRHTEWITHDPASYVNLARQLAAGRVRLGTLRAHLRDEMKTSPLLDHSGQAAFFGEALRTCWRNHCAAGTPSLAVAQ